MKPLQLLALLPQRPAEFFERAAVGLELRIDPYLHTRPHYPTEGWADVLPRVGQLLKTDLVSIMREESLEEIESNVRDGIRSLPPDAPFPSFHNGDFRIGRLCYAVARALRPVSVVETGVCYGVTSSFILKALEQNGSGTLYSIDLPPLGSNREEFVGWLIPKELKAQWRLSLGTSRQWLPKIVRDLEGIDMFLHDSLHTYGNISKELQTVTPKLSKHSVVVADDIEGNSAFLEWVSRCKPKYGAMVAEDAKESLMGISVFTSEDGIRQGL
jgi:predicted O-methyltransferase YrrM